ncbi:hypothetical protein [Methylobacterium sp. WL1]|uniref:hypothetical protein n=1 Tax=Methylobacterium sp. WL1 TaxID=2603276 RepID=UPI0011C201F3|nr:hypothetical protein [Methylobacterium sp. WL1]QEE37884.1 hypothetical protein FVA80_01855 [Methylobacterium sp. WL1]TXN59410.1 hypothetical protein FV241_02555 [Methylobacterium sp. WL2]
MALQPPAGFRFAGEPPRVGDIVHLDNKRPYFGAVAGEPIVFYKGICHRVVLGRGEVIGRMNADDPRANAQLLPRDTPGIFFQNERGALEWRSQGWFRDKEGRLIFTR